MLDQIDVAEMIAQNWDKLPSRPALPGKWSDFLDKKGPLPSMQGCRRRVGRFHFRQKAILERDGKQYAVWTKDVSRNSIIFICGFQLFPRDQVKLLLPDGPYPKLIVARCLRHAKSCYECGSRFALDAAQIPAEEAEHVAAILKMAAQSR